MVQALGGTLYFGLPTRFFGCGSISVCGPSGAVTRRGSRGDCAARSSDAHLAIRFRPRQSASASMESVLIGVDPHKLSATIEVVDRHVNLLGSGRFTTDKAGYAAMRSYLRSWPNRCGRSRERTVPAAPSVQPDASFGSCLPRQCSDARAGRPGARQRLGVGRRPSR